MPFSRLAALAAALPLFAGIACGGASKPADSPASGARAGHDGPAEVGHLAPDLAIQPLNGAGDVKLDALAGKVVVVDFWATWCGPCRQSFPGLEALAKRFPGQVQVVGVSVNDEREGIVDFTKELGTTFPVGWDDGHAIAERWHVSSMPSSFVVDGSGTVRYVHAGYRDGDGEELEKEVASLLGKTASPGDADKPVNPPPAAHAAPSDDAPVAEKPRETAPPPAKPKKKGAKGKKKGSKSQQSKS